MIGVLALQGGVEEHVAILNACGASTRLVRLPADLEGLDGIVLPGGESSVIDRLARSFGLAQPLRAAIAGGLPVLATCAGLIYLARELDNPAPGQQTLQALDISVRRNAFGTQRYSAEHTVAVNLGCAQAQAQVEASFIRAPIVTRTGPGVEVIARLDNKVVGVRAGSITALSFHPEENGEHQVHQAWLKSISA